jgi:hypothetical protein
VLSIASISVRTELVETLRQAQGERRVLVAMAYEYAQADAEEVPADARAARACGIGALT